MLAPKRLSTNGYRCRGIFQSRSSRWRRFNVSSLSFVRTYVHRRRSNLTNYFHRRRKRNTTIFLSGGVEIGPHAVSSRRVIVVLSPESLGNVWNETNVGVVLNQLSSLTTRTIVIITKNLLNTTAIAKRSSRAYNNIREYSPDRLKVLHWNDTGNLGSGSHTFWYKLRLAMPPIRPISSESGCQSVAMIVQANGKCGQQKARSRESLEVLV